MADTQIQEGDQVSWQWSGSRPSGEVAEVAETREQGELAIESNKGSTIKTNADPEDSTAHIARPGNDVVRPAHEVEIEKANGVNEEKQDGPEKPAEEKKDEPEKQNGVAEPAEEPMPEESKKQAEEPKTGQKRKAEDEPAAETNGAKEDEKDEEPAAKKQKTDEVEADSKAKSKPGRPKKEATGLKKEKKEPVRKRQPKKPPTADGRVRRSARNKS
ncbi:hypothetical protein K469DRAFT_598366 [Zopfia rhizophila CBS 207.26]|uniref:Hypervirulence associated protein TUDOR domain-containing protein n=1 Tax=Zopfia rhizophila CBS 207.26 TaxID=1314779 RepID=A0A6A6DIP0_9PEZI|nr:hypothetical protein K469DRAFT_598366 [Zopfia rhizophila CBS 207.26]